MSGKEIIKGKSYRLGEKKRRNVARVEDNIMERKKRLLACASLQNAKGEI